MSYHQQFSPVVFVRKLFTFSFRTLSKLSTLKPNCGFLYCPLWRFFVCMCVRVCSRNSEKMSKWSNTSPRLEILYLLIRSQAGESVWGYQLASGRKHIAAPLALSALSGYPLFVAVKPVVVYSFESLNRQLGITHMGRHFFSVYFDNVEENKLHFGWKKCSLATVAHHDSIEEWGADVLVLQVVAGSLVSSDARCSWWDFRRDEMPSKIQYVGVLIKSSLIVSF